MVTVRIALFEGVSVVSRLIRWQTRSSYSHVAAIMQDGSVIEAWHKGGVRHVHSLDFLHTPGTLVHIFEVNIPDHFQVDYFDFLMLQVGKKYDFRSVFRFITRKRGMSDGKWFCSELVFEALQYANIVPLRRIQSQDVSPQLLSLSPFLKYKEKIITQ